MSVHMKMQEAEKHFQDSYLGSHITYSCYDMNI